MRTFPALRTPLLLWAALLLAGQALAADPGPDPDRALRRLQEYLRIDTTNPPGNESRAVAYLGAILDAEGIPWETFEAAPGRGSLVARIPGGDAPALLLLTHGDVVPADASAWDEPPLSGALRDGYLYGRGALDTKGLTMLQLEAFISLHRSGRTPDRDVLFAVTADEEAGGRLGARALVEDHPDLIRGVGLVLNEGGSGRLVGGTPVYGIEVTQKIPLWLRISAHGIPGHASSPRVETAPNRLIRALERIADQRFTPRISPVIAESMRATADLQPPGLQPLFLDPSRLVSEPEAMLRLQLDSPAAAALLRDTCTITRLSGGAKINVVPATAWAEVDCRLLPDTDPARFLADLRRLIDDDGVEVTREMGFTAASSSTDTELYRVMDRVLRATDAQARVVPVMAAGFTDSHWFRDLGISAYGFSTLLLPPAEYAGVHGDNERVDVDAFRAAVRPYAQVVSELVSH